MTFKKKTAASVDAAEETKQEWSFEDGTTVDSSPEHRAWYTAEYKRRQKEVLPKHDKKSALFAIDNE